MQIEETIVYLFAIQAYAKNVHYRSKGDAFYAMHLLADKVQEGIQKHIDTIIETCILPYGLPLPITEYWLEASRIIKTDIYNFRGLQSLIEKALEQLETVEARTRAENAIIDDVARDLTNSLGLITRQVG